MKTNQKTQSNSVTNTTNGQNRLVEFDQGGFGFFGGRTYKNYNFMAYTENQYEPEVIKEYSEIAKEFITLLSENKVVSFESSWEKTRGSKRDFWGRWTLPIYVEDGKMQELKQELKSGKWGKQLWADYMWYEQRNVKTIFLHLNSIIRYYIRKIVVIQRRIEMPFLERMVSCGSEVGIIGVTIFPHSEIKYYENDKETIHNYYHSDDFEFYISYNMFSADITIELNEKYISLEQMLDTIEPLFEKRGIKIRDKTDPYGHFPADYVEYNEFPCHGYQFFD